MDKTAPGRFSGLVPGLRVWGIWPCAVMILSQQTAAHAMDRSFPLAISLLTFSGTAAMYGADRFLERLRQKQIADRHRRVPFWDGVFVVCIFLAALPVIPQLSSEILSWLAVLGVAGAFYLAVTVRLLRPPLLLKELLGAFCFSCLVWGLLPLALLPICAFYMMATANFMLSSHADRQRDAANGLHSLAISHEMVNLWLARFLSIAGASLFFWHFGWTMLFGWVALAHGLWPAGKTDRIDLAFIPLLGIVPIFFSAYP